MNSNRRFIVRRIGFSCVFLLLLLFGCRDDGLVGPDPDEIVSENPPPTDVPLIAYTVYYEEYSEVVIAPLDSPSNYKRISPPIADYFRDPTFSPSKTKVLFRNGPGKTYLYDIEGDSSYVLFGNVWGGSAPILPVQVKTWSVQWSSDEESFIYDVLIIGVNTQWNVARYSIPDQTVETLFWNHAFKFSVSPDTIAVWGPLESDNMPLQLYLTDLPTLSLSPVENPRLVLRWPPQPQDPDILEYFQWNSDRRQIVMAVREESAPAWTRYLAITNLDGSIYTPISPKDVLSRKPRWGPGNTIYYERFSSPDDSRNKRNQKLMVLDLDTFVIREVISRSVFTGAVGVGSCDV